jgi:RNA polymerase sigma-70 factor (ECF subfamily)
MLAVAGTDQLPVRRARAGDAEAWDVLFRRYQLPLYVYVHELVRDEQVSLDLVQETFINAARHIGSLRSDLKFGSWLFGIAHQKVLQRWRRPDRTVPLDDGFPVDEVEPGETPVEWLIQKEQEEQFMSLLHQLPVTQRDVLTLHFLEEFSLQDISEIVGVPLGTVKSRLHHAKRALRQRMEAEHP